jgi:thiosulfate dehydrogenase
MKPVTLSIVSLLAGFLLLPILVFLYLAFGRPPVAATDKPFPFEEKIVDALLDKRLDRDAPKASPIPTTDENLNAGAGIYQDKCEVCHGTADSPSAIGRTMFPIAPQFWIMETQNGKMAMMVSDDPVGETWWKVKNGIRLTGMPAYGKILTDTQIWQVSLLLSRSSQPLPAEASHTVGR